MSARDMWKMLHLLNNTRRNGLTTAELFEAGVDCYSDTLINLPADLKPAHYLESDLGNLASAAQKLQGQREAWRDHRDIKVAEVESLFA